MQINKWNDTIIKVIKKRNILFMHNYLLFFIPQTGRW